NLGAEPELMPKTPSQRRRPKKRQSLCPRDDNKEPNRRRLSRRRSRIKVVSSKPGSQRRLSKEPPLNPSHQWEQGVSPQTSIEGKLPALTGEWPAEAPVPEATADCRPCPQGADGSGGACVAGVGQLVPQGDAAVELCDVASVAVAQTAREGQEPSKRASASTHEAAGNRDPALLQDRPEKELLQDSDGKTTPERPNPSLAGRRESVLRRSVSRAISKKAAVQESSSASSRASCQSSLEVFVEEDVTSSIRPGLEPTPLSEKTPDNVLVSSRSAQAGSPPAQPLPPPEPRAGNLKGGCVNLSSEPQNQEQSHCAKPQENPRHIWTRSYKQAMGTLWSGLQPGAGTLSPLDDKHKNSANQTPPSPSPASKVVRPLKNFLQAVQRNQLLASAGPAERGGGIKSFIRRNTPTRPAVKERERQRLESLRKKQEAEEQRKKKVEEEKRRRQAEMKQKREERQRKALQARERMEQMEEEKKKRMEQKMLQNDEKVRSSHSREEKVAEERSRKKLSKKLVEADGRRQKVLRGEEDELEQPEPLQNRREGEVREGGRRVLELKNVVEQQQAEQIKERDHKQRGKEKAPPLQLESAALAARHVKEEESPKLLHRLPWQERAKPPESAAVALNPWLGAGKEDSTLREPQQPGEEKKLHQPAAPSAAAGTWPSQAVKPGDGCGHQCFVLLTPLGEGSPLHQAILHQYYHPVNIDQLFGLIPSPKLEDIFGKSKPRYFKRTSSAVWHSPPESTCGLSCNVKL
ncbi:PREDICTED: inner centromere protein-like, partial [Buceros rhinoceros silvestris]|uniref:inner centromere protein-like n=1 Tax=Buceros rhinoceros silvestris TaxID=175836 RepID=UPI000528F6C1